MTWQQQLRQQFPVTAKCTYMDTAFDCGGSLLGKTAAAQYFDDWADAASKAIKGGPGRQPFFDAAKGAKAALGALLGGVEPKNIAITKNTNEGINAILQGFEFNPGDNVVTLDTEYPSVVMPCLNAEALRGVECRLATLGEDRLMHWQLLWDLVDEHTAMIVVSHVQSSTGYKIDLETLGRKCREKGIFLVVDAVQSLGLSVFEADKWCIDAVSGGGYKGLGAIISIGYLWCSDRLLSRIRPVYVSNNFGMSLDYSESRPKITVKPGSGAAMLENCSTDYLGVYVLRAGVQCLAEIGMPAVESHIDALYEALYDGLSALGYAIVTPRDKAHRCASVVVSSANSDAVRDYFVANKVIISGGRGTLRISIGPYTSVHDIDETLRVAGECPLR